MLILPIVILAIHTDDDRDYMEWLYNNHYRLMFSTAWKIFRDKNTVEDVVSESCVALMKNIPTLRSLDRNRLRIYIVSTVRNTALNFFDKQQRLNRFIMDGANEALESATDNFDVEKKVMLDDELKHVLQAIARLSIKEQQILRMKYVLEMSDEQIAREVGLAPSSIRKCIGRAREKIKAIVYVE